MDGQQQVLEHLPGAVGEAEVAGGRPAGHLATRQALGEGPAVGLVATLPAPDIFEVISNAEPLGEVLPARYPASTRRRYERLERFPDGYLVTGDAV